MKIIMESVHVGIIGLGNMGSAHSQTVFKGLIEGMTLAAVCDIAPSRREWAEINLPGIPIFEDYSKMLKSGLIDTVIIAVPHYGHPIIACEAFSCGLNVLSEKPAGVSISSVKRMNEAAKASGKVFGIMFNQRTHPLFAQAREMVQSGRLGEPKRFSWTVTNWYRTQGYYDSGSWRASWAGEGGGVLLNQAPHNLDLWQWIFGMPSKIHAFCGWGKYHNIEVEDEATIYAEYSNGATAMFITGTGEYPGTNRLEITGDRGKLVLEEGKLRYWKLDRPEREFCYEVPENLPEPEYTEFLPPYPEEAHAGILRNFTRAILYGEALLAPGYDGINELTISNAAYLSAWTGKTIELPLDTAEFDRLLAERAAVSSYSPDKESKGEATGRYKSRWSVNW